MKSITKKRNGLCLLAVILASMIAMLALACAGCSGGDASSANGANGSASSGGKSLIYGTTGYGVEMDDAGLNPHQNYSGWSAVRYGVGETLFRFGDDMEPQPWLATDYEFTDDTHCKINLREGVSFTSGRIMDAQAVKECLDDLLATNDRAPADTKISSISASEDGKNIIVETSEPCPALINYLCDPYGAIIDMQAGVTSDNNVSGTGPYKATSVTDTEISLVPNTNYWNGTPKLDSIIVRSITDGDTLTAALQSGQIDACYGLPYASYSLVENTDKYTVSSCNTSRTFFGQINYGSQIMQDSAVREAICLSINKDGFISTLLNGKGQAAVGAFPASMQFGDDALNSSEKDLGSYNPDRAKQLLEQAGWVDSDGDGIREKDGQKLSVRWLTYPGRPELPLLAESAQATLADVGIDVQVNSTANHTSIRKDASAWDIYASALVTAPTGDPEYFFSSTCLSGSSKNFGGYASANLDAMASELHGTFDASKRAELAVSMQKELLSDHGYFFASHLTMGLVSKSNVHGLVAHPCDYYEITVDTDVD